MTKIVEGNAQSVTWFLKFSFDNNWVSQLYSELSVILETVENKTKTRTLLFRLGYYRRRGKIYRRSLRDCSLLASGIFLKTEIKSGQPKMPGTRVVLSCRPCPSPQPSWGGFGHWARAQGHAGRSANQNLPGWCVWLLSRLAGSPWLCEWKL